MLVTCKLPARLLAYIAGFLLLFASLMPAASNPVSFECGTSRLEAPQPLGLSFVAVKALGQLQTSAPVFTKAWDPSLVLSQTLTAVFAPCPLRSLAKLAATVYPDRRHPLVGVVVLPI